MDENGAHVVESYFLLVGKKALKCKSAWWWQKTDAKSYCGLVRWLVGWMADWGCLADVLGGYNDDVASGDGGGIICWSLMTNADDNNDNIMCYSNYLLYNTYTFPYTTDTRTNTITFLVIYYPFSLHQSWLCKKLFFAPKKRRKIWSASKKFVVEC